MKSLFEYVTEAIAFDTAREYLGIERDKKAKVYMNAFWETLKEYVLSHGGSESRNSYRLYIPYTGKSPEVEADDSESAGSSNDLMLRRSEIKDLVSINLKSRGMWIEKWDYLNGTLDIGFLDHNDNKKIRQGQKIGKTLAQAKAPAISKELIDFYASDPLRLSKGIQKAIDSKKLTVVISNHAYDIAGMSTGRDWTSCMNIIDGINKVYVEEDIRFGTLVAYIISSDDTNIQKPYGRILIKPFKLRRPGHIGNDVSPIVYSTERTVYSPYIGLDPIRLWLKDICEEIQSGDGILRTLKNLYNDNFRDKDNQEFHGRK